MTGRRKNPGAHGHDMGKAARIETFRDFKGSGLSDPLPKRGGKFAHIDGQLDLFGMGVIEMPGDDGEAEDGTVPDAG